MDIYKYIVIFVVGAMADVIVNFLVSSMQNPTSGLLGLKTFYTTLPWYMAALYAGLIFVVIYWISDLIYKHLLSSSFFPTK
ncbi:MAG: hypothetical protein WD512_04545 [Candidatus Paceibacterota bacterium]